MIKPTQYASRVLIKEEISSKATRLTLQCVNPPAIEFIPGQFINLKCGQGGFRAYSIVSDYKNQHEVSIIVETGHAGLGSDYVNNLKINDEVIFIGPSGKLSLCEPLPNNLCFFATGTGIAPFLAMFYRLVDLQYLGCVKLFVGFRREAESLELDLIDKFSMRLSNFSYVVYFSQPESQLKPQEKIGYVTQEISSSIDKETRYFACGHPIMVEDVIKRLTGLGIPQDNIVTEGFTKSVKA